MARRERMAQARGGLATGFILMTMASIMHREGMITGSQGQVKGEKTTTSRDLKKSLIVWFIQL